MDYKNIAIVFFIGILALFKAGDVVAQTPDDGNITEIVSDNTWKSTNREEAWWHSIGHDDSGWINTASPSNGTCGQYVNLSPNIAQPMWDLTPVVGGHAYFRKKFTLKEKPQKAILTTVFDDDGDIYINSSLIRQDRSGSVNPEPFVDDITQFLNVGDNVVGLYVIDTAEGCQSAQVRVDLTILYDDIVLNVPLTKQDDTQWQNDVYAGGSKDKLACGDDLKSCGCAVASLSMVMNNLGSSKAPNGKSTTPQTINEYFKENQSCSEFGCVSTGYAYGAVRWAAANQYSKEAHRSFGTTKIQLVDRSGTSMSLIRKNIESGNPVILQSPDKQHWFVGYGVSQNNILIRDPFYSRYSLSEAPYLNNAAAMVRYERSNVDQASIQVYGAPGEQILIQDEKGRRVGYDAANKTIVTDIPGSSYYFESHAGHADQNPKDVGRETGDQGVWVININAATSGQFNVDVTNEQKGKQYEYVAYGTDASGDVSYKVGAGKIASQGDFESKFSFLSNPQGSENIIKLDIDKESEDKQVDKIIANGKNKSKKSKGENEKVNSKQHDRKHWLIRRPIIVYVGNVQNLFKNIFVARKV